jgi:putative radical SAM enzyme (TIGR03279 family)
LSFLYGNYTTLTSITNDEMKRIVEQRLSPQYVSVHATDPDVRAFMLGIDRTRADISDKLKALLDAGIEVHAQVVLCPKINDGEVLLKTIGDLAAEYPRITSVAIVPLGLTRYNKDSRLHPVTPEFCRIVIDQLKPVQEKFYSRLGTSFALLGDEIYLKAGRSIPSRSHYGSYPQIEDGVGMVRAFHDEFARLKRNLGRKSLTQLNQTPGTILTGTLFAPILKSAIDKLNAGFGTKLLVKPVINDYFGGDVSVAGLVTGRDIKALPDQLAGEFVLIPRQMLKSDEAIMLDGTSLDELTLALGRPVYPVNLKELGQFLISKN